MRQKSILRKLVTGAAVFAMAFSMMSPISAKAATKVSAPEKKVVYQNNKNGGGWTSIAVNNIPKGQKVLKATSNKETVAKPYSVYYNVNEYSNEYLDKNMTQHNYSGSSRYADIEVDTYKTGTATISYRIGKSNKSYKTYKTKLTVLAYENPIKSLTISGVNDGKNLASAFKTSSYVYDGKGKAVTKNQSNGKVVVKANANWKITYVSFSNDYDNSYMYISYPQKSGRSQITLPVGTLKAGKGARVNVSFYNTKTGGTLSCNYPIKAK